jgi:hypothetical protein
MAADKLPPQTPSCWCAGTECKDEKGPRPPCTRAWQKVRLDLFSSESPLLAPKEPVVVAHCVSRCLHMSKGIALRFRQTFGRVDELHEQKANIGDVAWLVDGPSNQVHIGYLVTKALYWHLPTYAALEKTLVSLREYCVKQRIWSIYVPPIGCGLDKLEWPRVSAHLHAIFDTRFRLTVCDLK